MNTLRKFAHNAAAIAVFVLIMVLAAYVIPVIFLLVMWLLTGVPDGHWT